MTAHCSKRYFLLDHCAQGLTATSQRARGQSYKRNDVPQGSPSQPGGALVGASEQGACCAM